jgi:hypothetical protein
MMRRSIRGITGSTRTPAKVFAALSLSLVLGMFSSLVALANVPLTLVSSDPFTNTTSQHKTEVEPDTFSFGSTIIEASQVGRFNDGGASDIGWSTSTDNGVSWTSGFLPGITKITNSANPYDRVSDASVAYDAKHNVWLISSLPIIVTSGTASGAGVIVNRSTDGGKTWGNPVVITSKSGSDKNWTVCDNTPSSAFYGNCYTEWDDNSLGDRVRMQTSSDGGLTWGSAKSPSGTPAGLGGQPVVQPNGTVIVPIANASETAIGAFRSTNGGSTWSSVTTVASVSEHTPAGNLRSGPLPSAEIDSAGKVYVVWQDCRFRSGCSSNDIVLSTSTNGTSWSAVTRIPIDSTTSGVDHFIPGLGVDKATSGSTAHLALTYYYYPVASCTASNCQLDVGFISSTDGGASWSSASQLAGPMNLSWLPSTTQGVMVGDYISTSYTSDGKAHPVFAVANAPGSTFDEAMYTPSTGLTLAASTILANQVDNSNQHPDVGANNSWNASANEAHNGSVRD